MADYSDFLAEDFLINPGIEDLPQLDDGVIWDWLPLQPFDEGFNSAELPYGGDCSKDLEEVKDTNICQYLCGGSEGLSSNSASSASSINNSDVDRRGIDLPSAENRPVVGCGGRKSEARDSAKAKVGNHGGGENLEPKRQLRLVKNRESAYQSRQRKKSYIQSLESKCRMWESYCNQLQHSIAFICAENTVLRDELSRRKRLKGGNGVLEPAVLKDSPPLEFLSHLTILTVIGHLIGGLCLGWLVSIPIILHLGEPTKPSGRSSKSQTENEDNSQSPIVAFLNFAFKVQVLEAFPVSRIRALSSCHHWNRWLQVFLPIFSIPGD